MQITIGNFSYRDNLARKRRRRFFFRFWIAIGTVLLTGGVAVYAILFSDWFSVTAITVNGLKSVKEDQVRPVIYSAFRKDILAILNIEVEDNILLFDSDKVKNNILTRFPEIRTLAVTKDFPHALIFDVAERTVIGTWCSTDQCRYFDEEGVLWGRAVKTSGSLLLAIEDFRVNFGTNKVDENLLEQIRKIAAGLGNLDLKIKKIEIPAGSIGDLRVHVSENYVIIFDSGGNIDKQTDTLIIFLKDNKKTDDFRPRYIDLRIEGRVYYR